MYNFKIDLKRKLQLSKAQRATFKKYIYGFYRARRRSFSWREHITPYKVLVSEIMLQQTQTDRVSQKFDDFIKTFPSFARLAEAQFQDVLWLWKGLGYNRRALALQKIAHIVETQYGGCLPNDPVILQTFPGIGPATAASIAAFAFNKPTVFIETNVRTVFIYTFFHNKVAVDDRDLLPLVEQALDVHNPREWYYALMDYGVFLKKTVGNINRLSAHYTKQSKFENSDRQIRGMVLQILLEQPGLAYEVLIAEVNKEPARVVSIIESLSKEGFICCRCGAWWVAQ